MKILKFGSQYYCTVKCGFALQQIDAYFDEQLSMRRGSFAAQYTEKIFRDLFLYARDLRKEYHDYYVQEYDSFERFLYQKELWEQWIIDMLKLTLDETVLELRPRLSNYNAESLMDYEESGMETINQVLKEIAL